jgi:hypothetical protein
MSKTGPNADEDLDFAELAVIRYPVLRRLAHFRKHGMRISVEAVAEGDDTGDLERQIARDCARALGWSEDEHLPPAEMAAIRDPVRRRLAYFRKHGVWLMTPDDDDEFGDFTELMEDTRERARKRGCSPELVELMYGPSIHKKKDVGERKE